MTVSYRNVPRVEIKYVRDGKLETKRFNPYSEATRLSREFGAAAILVDGCTKVHLVNGKLRRRPRSGRSFSK